MGNLKEKSEEEKLQKDLEKKANNKFLDKVIIHMIVSVTGFTLLWTIMNAFNLTIQPEVIIGWFAFWGAEGGISAIITIKNNKKKQQKNSYNDNSDYGYIEPESYEEPKDVE